MMGLRIAVDPERLLQVIRADPDRLAGIAKQAKQAGAIHHRFYGNTDGGEILVVDEWPDAESFMGFFEEMHEIGPMMAEAGMTEGPTPVLARAGHARRGSETGQCGGRRRSGSRPLGCPGEARDLTAGIASVSGLSAETVTRHRGG